MTRALQELGFDVGDVDADDARRGDLLEDLRVTDPGQPSWVALAEVRGYSGGAKTSDLQRIGRFVERHVRKNGQEPDGRWYIVNHFLNDDPGVRPQPLASNSEDVDVFIKSGGLIVDTVTLFQRLTAVRRGDVSAADARSHFKEPGRMASP